MFRTLIISFYCVISIVNYANAEIYGGISLDYGIPHSGNERMHSSIILGNRVEKENYSYGGELDVGSSIDSRVTYTTLRVRFLVGLPLEIFTPQIGLGNTIYIDNGKDYASFNISGGIETDYFNNSKLRLEAIRDFNPDHTTPVTAIRVAFLLPF